MRAVSSSADPARLIVVYDGDCAICTRFAQRLARWDARDAFTIIPFQTPDIGARFPWVPIQDYTQSLHVINPMTHETWKGAAAFEVILGQLPQGRVASWVLGLPFVRPIADRIYYWFAQRRGRCGTHCRV